MRRSTAYHRGMNATKPVSDVVLLDSLRASPAVTKAVAERTAAVIAERKKLRERLVEIEDGEPARRYLAAVKRHEAAVEEAKVAYDAFRAAEQRVAEIEMERVNASFSIRQGREEIITALHAGADTGSINEFVRWLRDELQQTRKSVEASEIVQQSRITGKKTTRYESNAEAVAARVLAINEAINEAEDLKLEADQSKVPERIAALREGLPPPVAQIASTGKDV
jgi:hypothetical protein